MATVHRGQRSKQRGRSRSGVAAGGEGMAHRCGRPRPVGVEDALDGSKRSLVVDVVVVCGTRGACAVGGAPLHAPRRFSLVRAVLALSAAASSLAPSSPIPFPAARGGRTRCGRGERVRQTLGRRAARPTAHARVRRCRGGGRGAAARTLEVQRGEGRVGLERGGQLLGPLRADPTACGTRGRTRGGRGERVRQ